MSQIITNVIGGLYEPYAFETITVSSTAKSLTASVYDIASVTSQLYPVRQVQYVLITSETSELRYRIDGTAPTTTVGHVLPSGSSMVLLGYTTIINFKIIASGSDGTIQVTYER